MQPIQNNVTESFLKTLGSSLERPLKKDEKDYLRHYFRRLSSQDYDDSRTLEYYEIALEHRKFAKVRKPGEVIIESYNRKVEGASSRSTEYTLVLVVVDDIPFLVNSLLMKFNSLYKTPERFLHPIFTVERDANSQALSFKECFQTQNEDHPNNEAYIQCAIEYTPEDEHQSIKDGLLDVIVQIRTSVDDWLEIQNKVRDLANELHDRDPDSELSEQIHFLNWIQQENFVYLGYCEVEIDTRKRSNQPILVEGSLLGNLKTICHKEDNLIDTALPPVSYPNPKRVIYTKARIKAEIYYPSYMDCILIRHDPETHKGKTRISCVIGFLSRNSQIQGHMLIPYVRDKIEWILNHCGMRRDGHGFKELRALLTTLPRDKLLQMDREDLYRLGMTLLNQERRKTRVHLHRNICGHFYSCLVYIPRDLFDSTLRARIQEYMRVVFEATEVEFDVYFSQSILTRIHYIIHINPGSDDHHDQEQIETDVQNIARDWNDSLLELLKEKKPYQEARKLFEVYADAFPANYRDSFSVQNAIADIAIYEKMTDGEVRSRLSPFQRGNPDSVENQSASFKIYSKNISLVLSDVLPILENMGVRVLRERPYRIKRRGAEQFGLLDFQIARNDSNDFDFKTQGKIFEELFVRCWNGEIETNGFNALTLLAGLSWREIMAICALFRYLKQIRLRYSEQSIIETMIRYPELVKDIWDWFEIRLNPGLADQDDGVLHDKVREQLKLVNTLNEERIMIALMDVIAATLRTNFYQPEKDNTPKKYISFKINCGSIPRIPEPTPLYEVFVYSPDVEGVHLRGGKVARGGLRWSDRYEDFRTEVLGLVKAQRVKNAVIVPVGSKGGFVVKKLSETPQDSVQDQVIACYRAFIHGLLDLTDNVSGMDIIPPENVKRLDEDDPYLVVAADKGTATFSDIANSVAKDYGFWLGDAFASGGSDGYDHKRMGITARGAWESVKRHFRELGRDIQNEPFTVIGIGDMSGDVFGNGMLLSRKTRLVAAFNHLHILIDPGPDPETSYQERERLFKLPRSSWTDYNPECLSSGGAVYSRKDKSITISPQAMQLLGTQISQFTPDELINTILKCEADLLWNGGIGTYVKASTESHYDAQDRNNDNLRVDAIDLRCKVIGEGGNLGVTQLARIEYAMAGGRSYTDAIDNSGGVDTSDHEVNLKILLNAEVKEGALTMNERNRALMKMEKDVAELVLSNNYQQTQIISIEAESGKPLMSQHIRTITMLAEDGMLDRDIEFLPSHEELLERLETGNYLTRPELAVVLAYSKMDLYQRLVQSEFSDNSYLLMEIERYFPDHVRKNNLAGIHKHRLRREIIATQLTNDLVGCMGSSFHLRVMDLTGRPIEDICAAYLVARDSSNYRAISKKIVNLDNKVDAALQIEAFNRLCRSLESTINWILKKVEQPEDLESLINRYSKPYLELCRNLRKILNKAARERYDDINKRMVTAGFPKALAHDIACRDILNNGIDIVELSLAHARPVVETGEILFEVSEALSVDWIHKQIFSIEAENIWHQRAKFSLLSTLRGHHTEIVNSILSNFKNSPPKDALETWSQKNRIYIEALERKAASLKQETIVDYSMLSVIVAELEFIK